MFLLVDQETEEAYVGDAGGSRAVPRRGTDDGRLRHRGDGHDPDPVQVNDAAEGSPTSWSPPRAAPSGSSASRQAFEGKTTLEYDEATDTITDTETGTEYTLQHKGDREFYVDEPRASGSSDQSWQANVGLHNYKRMFTDSRISSDFLRIFLWTLVFARLSVATTFLLGLALAATLSDPTGAGAEDLPGGAGPPVRDPRLHLAAAVVELLQP